MSWSGQTTVQVINKTTSVKKKEKKIQKIIVRG